MANDNQNPGKNSQSQNNNKEEVGEGNREADRRYRDATEEYVKSGRPDAAGREAQRSVDDDRERRDLEDAERRARQGSPQPGESQPGKTADGQRGPNSGKRY
jgi:hypothetical protein